MNIPMSFLKQYVDLDCTIDEFIHFMTMSGSKVETVEKIGQNMSGVVVGKILTIEKHPDADKLVVCKVDIGDKVVQIVTGATNVFESAIIPVAIDGAILANNVKIKKGNLRGQLSEGMMCSVEELGYTRNDYPESPEHGIYIFTQEQKLGADVLEILEMREDVVEFEITSNRPDCFSVLGIAREAAATFDKKLKYPKIEVKETASGNISEMISVEIKNPELCPRYVARVVKNVKIEQSPQWLRHRLTASGIRPINNIVDITNYVMLEYGQPMHAFDIDNVSDRKIIVRNAKDDEMFTTLDGNERKLNSSMIVISDPEKALAIAGVMGGENSKITENASAILFESANFNGPNIRLTSKKLGLRTDSSSKYEKGIDPNLALMAINRAVSLVEELNCGEVVKGVVDCYPNKREPWTIKYSSDKINGILGTKLNNSEMEKILAKLEIKAENNIAYITTFRPDLLEEADLAEEIGRIYGYDNIETTLPKGTPTVGKKTYTQTIEDIIKENLVAQGLSEAMNYSFESHKVFDKLLIPKSDKLRDIVSIKNPLGEDFSVMRTTTLNGILQSLSTNYNRRNPTACLFEMAMVYLPKALPLTELPEEKLTLTIGMYGDTDFYDIKGVVETLLKSLGINDATYSAEKQKVFMHFGRCASVNVNNEYLGYLGEVHPIVLENYDIGTKAYIAVIDITCIFKYANLDRTYKQLPKFPDMQRDISMLVKEEVYVSEIEKCIRENGGKLLENIKLFDVYKGKQIEDGYKSVSYNLSFRASDRTLKDEEVSKAMNKILLNLENNVGAKLRDK